MPYVNIRITREGVTADQKKILIRDTTAMLERVLNKAPQTTHVVIDEIDTDNWGYGGESVTFYRQQAQRRKGND
jgi:4-oxalocrotonate tautomerase